MDGATPNMTELPRRVRVLDGDPRDWLAIERALDAQGHPVGLHHRPSFLAATAVKRAWLLLVEDAGGQPLGAAAATIEPTRALPGFLIAELPRFGPSLCRDDHAAMLQALARQARRSMRVLRVRLDLLATDDDERAVLCEAARALGFVREPSFRMYSNTLVVNLDPDVHSLDHSIDRGARRNAKKMEDLGHRVRAIMDERLAPRLDALVRETMQRSSGPQLEHDWERLIAYSREHPRHSRIAGMFLNGREDPESLVAFRWCGNHGPYVEDLVAASTRLKPPLPLMHAVAWDMLHWGHEVGAKWFDFGGIPSPDTPPDSPLHGIAAFKRMFSKQETRIREQMVMVTSPVANRCARAIAGLRRRSSL